MARTPWAWLLAAGLLLMGLSVLATAAFREENIGQRYVPGEVQADGRVSPGRFEPVE